MRCEFLSPLEADGPLRRLLELVTECGSLVDLAILLCPCEHGSCTLNRIRQSALPQRSRKLRSQLGKVFRLEVRDKTLPPQHLHDAGAGCVLFRERARRDVTRLNFGCFLGQELIDQIANNNVGHWAEVRNASVVPVVELGSMLRQCAC